MTWSKLKQFWKYCYSLYYKSPIILSNVLIFKRCYLKRLHTSIFRYYWYLATFNNDKRYNAIILKVLVLGQ